MPYEFLPELATADIAFRVWGKDLHELFIAAGNAVLNVMIDNPDQIEARETRLIQLANEQLDMLLFDALQELVYYKDTEQLLLRFRRVEILKNDKGYNLRGELQGEFLDPKKHLQRADVKAVTLHRFELAKTADGWYATVVLDI